MKKLLVLLFSILISFNSYGGFFDKTVCVETDAQERGGIIYLPNKTKPFTGKNLCEYDNGQYKSKGKVKEGKKDDNWTEWDRNGLKQSELHYKDGKLVGKTKYDYHSNGQRASEVISKNGKKKKHTLYRENGQKMIEFHCKDGKLDGVKSQWEENGQKSGEAHYKDDKRDGKTTFWHEDGQLDREAIFKGGECISGDCDYMNTDWVQHPICLMNF